MSIAELGGDVGGVAGATEATPSSAGMLGDGGAEGRASAGTSLGAAISVRSGDICGVTDAGEAASLSLGQEGTAFGGGSIATSPPKVGEADCCLSVARVTAAASCMTGLAGWARRRCFVGGIRDAASSSGAEDSEGAPSAVIA